MVTVPASALQPRVDTEQASRHLELLHSGAPGYAGLILLGHQRFERHSFFPTSDLVDDPSTVDSSSEALQDAVDARWNVYTTCSTLHGVPEKGRGTRADVLSVPGVWADLDVKPDTEGYFRDESELQAFVSRLPRPTLQVASGSGGSHVYWLTHRRLEADEGQQLLTMWLDYMRRETGGYTIEYVHDTTRVLRLAGTVRWPRDGDDAGGMPRRVELVAEGPRYHDEELRLLARDAFDEARAVREERRALRLDDERRRRADLAARGLAEANYDRIVSTFNLEQDWAVLLECTGWTLHGDQRDGPARCRYWTRPGKAAADGKSASTDYTSLDGVTSRLMTVYSNDPTLTDLVDRTDEGVVGTCTKWRYALIRLFHGDEITLLRCVVANRGRLA